MPIREANIEDSAAIGHVQLASWKTMFPACGMSVDNYLAQFSDGDRAEAWQSFFARPQRPMVYVAETSDGKVIGFASSTLSQPEEPYACELLVIHILPDYRAQGIGRQLISATARYWHERGCESLWLWTIKTNPARAVYEHLGGVLAGEKASQSLKNDVTIDVVEVAYGWADITALF
jgi:GNAT superfamily N-acetyltransferase